VRRGRRGKLPVKGEESEADFDGKEKEKLINEGSW
jgi:hypothetical protein